MAGRMSLVLVSGTVDKLMAAGIITSGAVANDMEVDIFLSFWALLEFKKDAPENKKLSYEGKDMADQIMTLFKEKKVPSWKDTMKQAKDIGTVRIHACTLMADLMEIKHEDLDPLVDDVIGVGEFVDMAKNSEIQLFI